MNERTIDRTNKKETAIERKKRTNEHMIKPENAWTNVPLIECDSTTKDAQNWMQTNRSAYLKTLPVTSFPRGNRGFHCFT